MVTTYTTNQNFQKPAQGDLDWDEALNDNADALDALHTVGGLSVSISDPATPGLFVDVAAGRFRNTDGNEVSFAGASNQAVAPSDTNYAYLSDAGALTINTTGFPDPATTTHVRLATITTNSTSVQAITDVRTTFLALGTMAATGANHLNVRTITATDTATATDDVILVNGNATVNLPTAVGITGKRYWVKKLSGNVSVTADGTETIDGSTTFNLTNVNDYVAIVSDGSDWQVIAEGY